MLITSIQTIGKNIIGIRYFYNPENEFRLQEFTSIIQIQNNEIIQTSNYLHIYLTEQSFGPIGITNVDLKIILS